MDLKSFYFTFHRNGQIGSGVSQLSFVSLPFLNIYAFLIATAALAATADGIPFGIITMGVFLSPPSFCRTGRFGVVSGSELTSHS